MTTSADELAGEYRAVLLVHHKRQSSKAEKRYIWDMERCHKDSLLAALISRKRFLSKPFTISDDESEYLQSTIDQLSTDHGELEDLCKKALTVVKTNTSAEAVDLKPPSEPDGSERSRKLLSKVVQVLSNRGATTADMVLTATYIHKYGVRPDPDALKARIAACSNAVARQEASAAANTSTSASTTFLLGRKEEEEEEEAHGPA